MFKVTINYLWILPELQTPTHEGDVSVLVKRFLTIGRFNGGIPQPRGKNTDVFNYTRKSL